MLESVIDRAEGPALPVVTVTEAAYDAWRAEQPERAVAWLAGSGFEAKAGRCALLPGPEGALEAALLVVEDEPDLWSFAGLPEALPAGACRLAEAHGFDLDRRLATAGALGWMLGCYRFDRYKGEAGKERPVLVAPDGADMALARRLAGAVRLTRNLINTPANDMGPDDLEEAARVIADAHGAAVEVIAGEALSQAGYPMILAVGRASDRAPRLIDLTWGDEAAPRVTLVGKGVCFDAGGLNLKTAEGMRLMKKDMGGAAHVLGLAQAVMDAHLGLRLRVLVPAVDNVISGSALRPGDVLPTRAGTTVEVGNTDAEGRLVLADALAEADRDSPELVIDLATLTGAARVALGSEVPALFCDDDALAAELAGHAQAESDPLWRLPLWRPYRKQLDSDVADLGNISDGPHGGAITAALFLREFLEKSRAWAHLDIMAWNRIARPGRPKGGEAVALRALYSLLAARVPG